MTDREFLQKAIAKAEESVQLGGFPAGVIIVMDGSIVGEGVSIGRQLMDCTSHGDMAAMRSARERLRAYDIQGATLYAALQPCIMCFGAAMWNGITRVVFACRQERVSSEYYGGHYDIQTINSTLNQAIALVHLQELEEDVLRIVQKWEQSVA